VFKGKVTSFRPSGSAMSVQVSEGNLLHRLSHAFGAIVWRDQNNFVWRDRSAKKRAQTNGVIAFSVVGKYDGRYAKWAGEHYRSPWRSP
jgi:hypothetical protein